MSEIKNKEKIDLLEYIISTELKKDDCDVDTDLIEECLGYAMELKGSGADENNNFNSCFTDDELESKAKLQLSHYRAEQKKTFFKTKRKLIISAACIIIFMLISTAVTYSLNPDLGYYVKKMVSLAPGEIIELEGGQVTIQKGKIAAEYSDAGEFLEGEPIESVLLPSVFPKGWKFNNIQKDDESHHTMYFIDTDSRKEYFSYYFTVDDKAETRDEWTFSTMMTVNDITYYYLEFGDGLWLVKFFDNGYKYTMRCESYESMVTVINGITRYSR